MSRSYVSKLEALSYLTETKKLLKSSRNLESNLGYIARLVLLCKRISCILVSLCLISIGNTGCVEELVSYYKLILKIAYSIVELLIDLDNVFLPDVVSYRIILRESYVFLKKLGVIVRKNEVKGCAVLNSLEKCVFHITLHING